MQLNISVLAASLRQVESSHGLDVKSRVSVVKAAEVFSNSRYALAKALSAYRAELGHGAWMDASVVIGEELGLSDRTVRELVYLYKKTLPIGGEVLKVLEKAEFDSLSRPGQKIVAAILESEDESLSVQQGVEAAIRSVINPVSTLPSLSNDERLKIAVRGSIQSLVANVPPNKRLDVIREAVAEAIYELMGEFTITPKLGAIGLSGIRRDNVVPFPAATEAEVA